MKKAIVLNLMFLCFSGLIGAQSYDEHMMSLLELGQKDAQVLLLKGADCINCYRAGKIAIEQGLIHPDIVIVRDVPKRYIEDFLSESLGLDTKTIKVIYNDSLWNWFNPNISSAIAYISDGKIDKIVELKSILNAGHSNAIRFTDSLDLTSFYGGAESTIVPKNNNLVIYNEFKHQIIEYSPTEKKAIHTFNSIDKAYLSIDTLGRLLPDVDQWRIPYTNQLIANGEQMVKKTASIGGPYITPHYIYVPCSLTIVDTFSMFDKHKRDEVMYPYSFFAKYDWDWKLKQLIAYPFTTIKDCDTFCNNLSLGHFRDDHTFYMMVNSMKSDSLYATFTTDSTYHYSPDNFLSVSYPASFPKYSKAHHLMRYVALFADSKEGNSFYVFSLDNDLYRLGSKRKIKLEGIPDNNLQENVINSFIHVIQSDDKYLYVLYTSPRTSAYLNIYDLNDFHLVSSEMFYQGKITKMFFWDNFACVLKSTDDNVILYKYRY